MDIKKVISRLPVGFLEEAAAMDGEQLRAEIVSAESRLRDVDREQKADEKVAGARELLRDLVGAYNDTRKAQRAKIAYALHLLEERGELLHASDDGNERVAKAS